MARKTETPHRRATWWRGGAIAGPAPWLAHHGTSHQGKHCGVTELLDGDRLKEELVGLVGERGRPHSNRRGIR
ncbi:MAG: hypothetical protein R2690_12405 [Acidimicrobiales bacterium]